MPSLAILTSGSNFSYECGRCQQCCKTRRVYVNPYEILRLARLKGLSTSQLIESSIDRKTFSLKRSDDGSCNFLNAEGCSVYTARPLACRLYPLARRKNESNEVHFAALPPEPESTGIYGAEKTIADYLRDQQTELFEQWSDKYFVFFSALTQKLTANTAQSILGNILLEHVPVSHRLLLDQQHCEFVSRFFDIDGWLEDSGRVKESDTEAVAQRHFEEICKEL